MRSTKTYTALAALLAVAVLVIAACGGGDNGGAESASGGADPASTVSVGSADGVGEVLVDSEGSALYAADEEADGRVLCVDVCASIWIPLTVDGEVPTGSGDLAGSLGVATRPDGTEQVTFDGRLLYSFAEDTGPGVVTGNGFSDTFGAQPFTWHVATPTGISTTSENTSESAGGGIYDP